MVISHCSSCPLSSAFNIIHYFYVTLVLFHCSETNVTLQQNQCPIDSVNTPRTVVENTGCGIMSVSHTPNKAGPPENTVSLLNLPCPVFSVQYVHVLFSVQCTLGLLAVEGEQQRYMFCALHTNKTLGPSFCA